MPPSVSWLVHAMVKPRWQHRWLLCWACCPSCGLRQPLWLHMGSPSGPMSSKPWTSWHTFSRWGHAVDGSAGHAGGISETVGASQAAMPLQTLPFESASAGNQAGMKCIKCSAATEMCRTAAVGDCGVAPGKAGPALRVVVQHHGHPDPATVGELTRRCSNPTVAVFVSCCTYACPLFIPSQSSLPRHLCARMGGNLAQLCRTLMSVAATHMSLGLPADQGTVLQQVCTRCCCAGCQLMPRCKAAHAFDRLSSPA